MQGLIRIAVEAQIPVEAILGHDDLHHEGFDDTLRHILTFIPAGVLFQRVLEDSKLLGISRQRSWHWNINYMPRKILRMPPPNIRRI